MFTRRALAAFAGLTTGAAGLAAAAQTRPAPPPSFDGARCYDQLEGAVIAPDVDTLRTAGDSVVGIGAATFSTRLTRSPFARRFTAADVMKAIRPHILGTAQITGRYSLNPAVKV